jgi:peptidoglycan/LPS O-acetylase OafA/YrhL
MSATDRMTVDVRGDSADRGHERFAVLDGWRGISILLVLWGHWLPAGPRESGMNASLALSGMALFFTLSGFLITTFLYQGQSVPVFLIRRLMRVVPLAWLFILVTLTAVGASADYFRAHLLFYLNLPPYYTLTAASHLWSVCVELHFYLGVAALVALCGRKALYLLPLVCVVVTALRIINGKPEAIATYFRLDEILAGATLALAYQRWGAQRLWSSGVPLLLVAALAGLLLASSNPHLERVNYARPYVAAVLVGVTLFSSGGVVVAWLHHRVLAYVARVSYAIYVVHGGLAATWLGSGEGLVKYLKRPLLVAVTFGIAHLSTTQLEARAIALGRKWSKRFSGRPIA